MYPGCGQPRPAAWGARHTFPAVFNLIQSLKRSA
jgi:hypothetical protein